MIIKSMVYHQLMRPLHFLINPSFDVECLSFVDKYPPVIKRGNGKSFTYRQMSHETFHRVREFPSLPCIYRRRSHHLYFRVHPSHLVNSGFLKQGYPQSIHIILGFSAINQPFWGMETSKWFLAPVVQSQGNIWRPRILRRLVSASSDSNVEHFQVLCRPFRFTCSAWAVFKHGLGLIKPPVTRKKMNIRMYNLT